MSKLTDTDLNDLIYFWTYQHDLENLTSFKRLMPILEREKPEILKAWNDYKASIKILDLIMDDLV